ncbi:hypothetical protein IV203_033677 [Nitzschia inconspicua]|uniref:Uncharacterized protein n=1 Tax=Nitzschia inconspicua TaxID=303405 RepID=A0A9K3K543_9STRA|nr:hypothetical protein IV203_022863 [Nitzschia inconspicua]KAG7372953.1 hypothetical protein IV203_033677 [Nitzschia inconspicua]
MYNIVCPSLQGEQANGSNLRTLRTTLIRNESHPCPCGSTNLTANNSTDRALLSGRAIYTAAKKVESMGKKVLACVMKSSKYSDPNGTVSGEQWEDYLKYCRYMMT